MKGTEDKLADLAGQAMDKIKEFFCQEEYTGKDVGVARIATAVLSAWTRHEQTQSARQATMFMLSRELAADKEQLAEYINLTMPNLGLVKALPKAKS